jgi:putative ABC transport system ATP-binding protein
MPLVDCQSISKSFRIQKKWIAPLNDVSLSINAGERIVITGKSGAGKTVLFSLLCGLDRPDSGEIYYQGKPLSEFSMGHWARLRRMDVGIIFQNHNLIQSWTVLENVEAALMDQKERTDRARELLSQLGLSRRLNHLPHQLSMGEQQRVAVARTLVRQPGLILADEPTGDVDPETAKEIMDLLDMAVIQDKVALLVATHGNYPLNQADKVYILKEGRLTLKTSVG